MKYRETYRNGHRWYVNEDTGLSVPSVTTITSMNSPFKGRPGNAAKIGSIIHYQILKQYVPTLEMPKDLLWNISDYEVHDRIISALKMWKDLALDIDIRGVEDVIFNEKEGYAGRVDIHGYDALGNYNIYEIKTGNWYDHYLMQGAAYAKAIGANQVCYVMLDSNTARNPDRIGKTIIMTSNEIDEHFEEFLGLLSQFNSETLK